MKILMLFFLLLGFSLKTTRTWAIGLDEVNLLEISSSAQSISIDRGGLENYNEGSFAKFFIQTGDFKSPKIFLVAEGKLIKSFPKKSIWYFSKVLLPDFIKYNKTLLVLTSNQVKSGRSLKVKQRHVLLSPNEYGSVEQYLDQNKNNVPNRLLNETDKFEESFELY